MSRMRYIGIRLAGTLLAAAALTTGRLSAQPGGDGKPAHSLNGDVTAISTSGGPTLRSDDGGKTWRMVDDETAAQLRNELGRKIQAMASGAMTGNVRVSVDPYGTAATVEYTAKQTGDLVITLHDAQGVEVLRQTEMIGSVGVHTFKIDVTNLIAGSFYLKLTNNSSVVGGGKVIVTR